MDDKKNELVSIIIPAYNAEKTIEKCLDSVLNQTYKDIEILIVDDGSTDNTGRIISMFQKKDNRVKVISKRNGGISSARNMGIKNSSGAYIAFIDSDDWYDVDAIEMMYKSLKENDADIVAVRVRQVFPDNHYEYYKFSSAEKSSIEIIDLNKEDWLYFDNSVFLPVWNKLYKKECVTLFDEELQLDEDIFFNGCAYTLASKMVIIHVPKYNQLRRESMGMLLERDVFEDAVRIKRYSDNLVEYVKKINPSKLESIRKYINFRIDLLIAVIVLDRHGYRYRKKTLSYIKDSFPNHVYKLFHCINSDLIPNRSYIRWGGEYNRNWLTLLAIEKNVSDLRRRVRFKKH